MTARDSFVRVAIRLIALGLLGELAPYKYVRGKIRGPD
jgi:hypothetical protein